MHPPPAIEPNSIHNESVRRQLEIFAMRIAHNPRSCRSLQRNVVHKTLAGASGLAPELLASKASTLLLSVTPSEWRLSPVSIRALLFFKQALSPDQLERHVGETCRDRTGGVRIDNPLLYR
jgi:hypothetical protein